MKRALLTVMVGFVAMVALRSVDGLRSERSARRDQAARTIAESNGGDIALRTPALELSLVERYLESEVRTREVVQRGLVVKEEYTQQVQRAQLRTVTVVPDVLHAESKHQVETRFLGIMPGRVQHARVRLSGQFTPTAEMLVPHRPGGAVDVTAVSIGIGFGSVRTIEQFVQAKAGEHSLRFEPAGEDGNGLELVSAAVPASAVRAGTPLSFDLSLALRGGHTFTLHPLAERSDVALDADWPHPDFTLGGQVAALPSARTVTDTSTHAEWLTSGVSSGLKHFFDSSSERDMQLLDRAKRSSVGVAFVEPVDVFALLERSTKFGVPLIALSLALVWFILTRVKVRTHPMHYLLLALSLAVFFLLLLSLSEKVGFAVAYAASALAVSALNVVYLQGLTERWKQAAGVWLPTSGCIGGLYGVLVSEDSALLLGSLFSFALLAAFMLLTRRVVWHEALGPGQLSASPK